MRGNRWHNMRCGCRFASPPPPPPGPSFGNRGDNSSRNGPYRSRRGKIMGVCQGLGDYFGVRPKWIRIFAIILAITTGFWPVIGLYLIVGFIMKPEPVQPFKNTEERDFYRTYTTSKSEALSKLKSKFEDLDKRIRDMEDRVTSREYDWDRRLSEPQP